MPRVSNHDQGLVNQPEEVLIFTYYCAQCAEMADGVGVGVEEELVEEELVDEELVVDWEVLEVDDSVVVVVLDGGFIVSVQETVVISFDVDEELERLELERLVAERLVLEELVLGRLVVLEELVMLERLVLERLIVLERLVLERPVLERLVLLRLVVMEIELVEETVVFCWNVDVFEGPVTVTEPGLVVVMNVEEFQEVVMLGLKVEGAVVGPVPLETGDSMIPVAVEKPVQSLGM